MGNGDVNNTGANRMAASIGLVREVNIRMQDFWGFLSKLKLISQLILYELKFLSFSYVVISAFIYSVNFSLNNTLCKNLAIVYLSCFCIHTLYFCR